VCATKAFPGWSHTPAEERSRILNKIADLIEADLDEFAQAESKDNGKTVALARAMDIPRAVANFRFFASAILHHEEISTTIDGAINYTTRSPVGVAGLISPWQVSALSAPFCPLFVSTVRLPYFPARNLPLYLLTWKVAPAIAVGNTVVAKPSEMTSLTAWMMCGLLEKAGLPKGVVNMVFGRGTVPTTF